MLEQLGTNKITKYFGIYKDIEVKTKEDIYKIVIASTELTKTKQVLVTISLYGLNYQKILTKKKFN